MVLCLKVRHAQAWIQAWLCNFYPEFAVAGNARWGPGWFDR